MKNLTLVNVTATMWLLQIVFFLLSCNTKSQNGNANLDSSYSIISREKSEILGKAQLKIKSYLTKDVTTEKEIKKVLLANYESNKHEGGYKNFSEPTVIGIYLFTSKNIAQKDPSSWIGMLEKGPTNVEPYLSVNSFKTTALTNLKDSRQSKDEIELEKLNKLLTSKNLKLCDLNDKINNIEMESIHKADYAFPNYGKEHDDYSDKLRDNEWKKLEKKYNLTESDLDKIGTYANTYCK